LSLKVEYFLGVRNVGHTIQGEGRYGGESGVNGFISKFIFSLVPVGT
jgi:hypothetical protein